MIITGISSFSTAMQSNPQIHPWSNQWMPSDWWHCNATGPLLHQNFHPQSSYVPPTPRPPVQLCSCSAICISLGLKPVPRHPECRSVLLLDYWKLHSSKTVPTMHERWNQETPRPRNILKSNFPICWFIVLKTTHELKHAQCLPEMPKTTLLTEAVGNHLIVKAQALLTLPPQTRPSNKPIPCSSYPDARDPMFTEYLLPVTAPQVLSKFPDSTSTKLIAMQLFQKVGFIAIPSLHVRSCIAFCKDKQILTPRNGMLVPTELSAANTWFLP